MSDGADESRIALSLDEVLSADHSGLRAAVMDVLALLADAGASRWLLRTAGELGLLGGQVTPGEIDAALDALAGASLARRDGAGGAATVTAGPGAARVVLERRAREGGLLLSGARVRELLDVAIKSGDEAPDVHHLVHGIAALSDSLAPYLGAEDAPLIEDLLDLRGWGLWALSFEPGDARLAIEVGEPLVADYARVLGPAHPAAWESRRNLGIVYEHAGRYADAIEVYAGLLADQELALPADDPELAITRENLAQAQEARDSTEWAPDE
jgi:hypothetical protein